MALVDADTCSGSSLAVDEPLAGTAPFAIAWIAIEQVGPFGRDALRQSHFPIEIADELLASTAGLGIRPAMIRRVGKHADSHREMATRRVFLASSRPGRSAMTSVEIADPAEILEIDFMALASGDVRGAWAKAKPMNDPLLLVCTNAKRDVCCAMKGRPVAAALTKLPRNTELVWETSHLGGHRFAATAVQLPHGWVHGRLDGVSAASVLDGARLDQPVVPIATARGRSSLSSAEQAADIAARQFGVTAGIDSTRVESLGDDVYTVTTESGGSQGVRVTEIDLDAERRESCAKAFAGGTVLRTTIL